VPEDYHELLCRYAAGRAASQSDVDGQRSPMAGLLLKEFDDEVREARQDRQPRRWIRRPGIQFHTGSSISGSL